MHVPNTSSLTVPFVYIQMFYETFLWITISLQLLLINSTKHFYMLLLEGLIIWYLKSSLLIFIIGRSGRAGRSGEAITFYTEDDIPFLRNIANVMKASGCEVPSWILALPKLKGKKHRPRRDSISTRPKDEVALSKPKGKKHRPRRDSVSTRPKDEE